MWRAIFDIATGGLVSTGTVVADPLPNGLASVPCGEVQPVGQWDAATLTFIAVVAPTAPLTALDFMRRFTVPEEAAIRTLARTDAVIEVFLSRLGAAQSVHLDNAETIGGVNYCVAKGCITAARGVEILNG